MTWYKAPIWAVACLIDATVVHHAPSQGQGPGGLAVTQMADSEQRRAVLSP